MTNSSPKEGLQRKADKFKKNAINYKKLIKQEEMQSFNK